MKDRIKSVAFAVGGVLILVASIVAFNLEFWAVHGNPRVPTLEGEWWAGYYETRSLGRQWCVARFSGVDSGTPWMALLSARGDPDLFRVERDTNDRTFVHLVLTDSSVDARIEAKQLYEGKRYIVQRLLVGRWRDFWRLNQDIAIRGNFVSLSPPQEFAIEPIDEAQVEAFWRRYVRPEKDEPSPGVMLKRIGFRMEAPRGRTR